jgi:8-oxo-dGTP pyrophosphatase MutT (NUDIX family)
MVVREGDGGAEVLLLRRHAHLRAFAGYWVFPGGALDPTDESLDQTACRELLEETALRVAPADLRPWAHWLTPSAQKVRFDTRFYLVRAPREQALVIADYEASEGRWFRLGQCLDPARPASLPLMPPTVFVLRELQEALHALGSLDEVLEHARSRTILPVLPKQVGDPAADSTVVFPWDPEYERLPGEGIVWDEPAIRSRAAWPTRLDVRRTATKKGTTES